MQDRDIVADPCSFAHDEAGGVVKKDAFADMRGRVDIRLEHVGRAALQVEREVAATIVPEPVGQAMGLDRMETLEVEHRLHEPRAGRVAIVDGLNIDAQDRGPFRPVAHHRLEGLAQNNRRNIRVIQPLADAVDHTIFQRRVAQHCRMKESREHGIAIGGQPGFVPQAVPNRIHGLDGFGLEDVVVCDHCRSPRSSRNGII